MDPPGLAELASPWHPWRFHLPDLSPNGPEVNPVAPRPPAPFAEAPARLAQAPAVGVVGAPVGGRDLGEVNVPRVPIGGPEIARPEELGETAGSSSETSTACTALFKEDSGELDPSEEPVPPTTIMMRNIPSEFSGHMLLQLLNQHGFKGSYDLVYLPMDYHNKVGFGYAFINFVDATQAERFRYAFEGFHDWGVVSEKVCEVCWSSVLQGVAAHVERYRNSPVMHPSVPDSFKPMLFRNGDRVAFPAPTKTLRPPRLRKKGQLSQVVDCGDALPARPLRMGLQ